MKQGCKDKLSTSLSLSVLESITRAYLMVSSKVGDPKERDRAMAASNKAVERPTFRLHQ